MKSWIPDNRNFAFDTKLSFNAGLGIHLFLNRWLAFVGEGRTYVFNDKLENTTLAQGLAGRGQRQREWRNDEPLAAAQDADDVFGRILLTW